MLADMPAHTLAHQADCVGETLIATGIAGPSGQFRGQGLCRRCGGACVRVAALSKTVDSPGYRIFQCLDCADVAWVSGADRNLR